VKLALIGGSGFSADMLDTAKAQSVSTPYGLVNYIDGCLAGTNVVFLARHGAGHKLPPHRINYRANIAALHSLGVEGILATNAVGSLRLSLLPGSLVVLNSFIDFTSGREGTFYDGDDGQVIHTDVTEPFCPALRKAIFTDGAQLGIPLSEGCYVCTNGPRYETAAEVKAFALLGGDVVGMTCVPEVVLAREKGICYAGLGLVTNMAAGLAAGNVAHEDVLHVVNAKAQQVKKLLTNVIQRAAAIDSCTH